MEGFCSTKRTIDLYIFVRQLVELPDVNNNCSAGGIVKLDQKKEDGLQHYFAPRTKRGIFYHCSGIITLKIRKR